MTDRMDCQFIMGFFTFMYYQSFIKVYKASVGGVIEMAVVGLSDPEVVEVVRGLVWTLVNRGVVGQQVSLLVRAHTGHSLTSMLGI
jgi:phosphatidate cytidylyltransferase